MTALGGGQGEKRIERLCGPMVNSELVRYEAVHGGIRE